MILGAGAADSWTSTRRLDMSKSTAAAALNRAMPEGGDLVAHTT